jgi:hypothetical protein
MKVEKMSVKKLVLVGIMSLLLSAPTLAETVVADFNSLSSVLPLPGVFVTQGVTFEIDDSAANGPIILRDNFAGGDGNELAMCGYCEINYVSFYMETGNSFKLDSFLLGSQYAAEGVSITGSVVGHLDSGGTVTQDIYVAAGAAHVISFDTAWIGLSSVDLAINPLTNGGFDAISIDNVTLQAVPIPAAVWLFGSGLGLLGWVRRKRET